ncbi:hypothetical protein BTE48_15865 [Oceanospirillum multiglobuliferum]|uniref:Uncharacterized protein n=2 Tax=Oceanospirillum multiglobuliferum TaxID=64969 RepID=A0A1V4T0J7_9GAMM|nr:hypothetical protein BTE48_15865 [Oceanospirillum multiglobuliferum]
MHPTLGCGVLAWVFTVHDAALCTLRWVMVFWLGCLRCMTLRLCTLRWVMVFWLGCLTVHDATLMHPTLGYGVLAWVFNGA